ncbi:uncharacterized protein LOC119309025 [Triticum dicoccoides]|uniref:uncharacterized protein LOC119309025 n=1 Tax=Triticum dicoccoides TaxID=85692 RepID=UPI0018917FE5|nr:uncharacterized protein LOC119309025 [Triticum dicoccoides]
MDLPPLSQQALFAALRSADAKAVRRLLAGAEESALYVPVDAEAVRLLLPLYDLEAAKLYSRLNLDAFHVAAKQGHTGFDAPRNSMEFAMEAPHSYGVFQEDVPQGKEEEEEFSMGPLSILMLSVGVFPDGGYGGTLEIVVFLTGTLG